MDVFEEKVFVSLFTQACGMCFGRVPSAPLTEAESKHFCNEIQEQTLLTIGWKSLKNYSLYILGSENARKENPSLATLDTFGRYVVKAEKTDELTRKKDGTHYPYWFAYLDSLRKVPEKKNSISWYWSLPVVVILIIGGFFLLWPYERNRNINEDFKNVSDDSLKTKGWKLRSKEPLYWKRNNEKTGHLTLFTLFGDNYDAEKGEIKNFVYRKAGLDCFTTEVQFSGFIPEGNWQQAGILLLEDTTMTGKNVRISLAYNDFFGGYKKPGEIIIQAVYYDGDSLRKPEEMAHFTLFTNEKSKKEIIMNNLKRSAIRIEKSGSHFRFLFASGSDNIFGFKEVLEKDIDFDPEYVGVFALKGHVATTGIKPVYVDFFSFKALDCK